MKEIGFIKKYVVVIGACALLTNVSTFIHSAGWIELKLLESPSNILFFGVFVGVAISIVLGVELARGKVMNMLLYLSLFLPLIVFDYVIGILITSIYIIILNQSQTQQTTFHERILDN